jgi:hypothetical protein
VIGYFFNVQNFHLLPPAGLPGAQRVFVPGHSPSAIEMFPAVCACRMALGLHGVDE